MRIRVKLGEGSDGEPPSIIALDTFNEPHLKVPDVGEDVTDLVPARGVPSCSAPRATAPTPTAEAGAEV